MKSFWCAFRDIIIAILRLILLQSALFVNGLHHILFNRSEVANISLTLIPQRRDRERLAFVEDLKVNNFDLATRTPIPDSDFSEFRGDDEFEDLEDEFDEDDLDDEDDK